MSAAGPKAPRSTLLHGGETIVRLHAAIAAAAESARVSLERLYAPAAVRLGAIERWRGVGALPLGRRDDPHLGVAFEMQGPVEGRLLIVAGVGVGGRLASALLRRSESHLDDDGRAAISEMANIAASSFLNGLARASNLRLLLSVPALAETALGELLAPLVPIEDLAFVAPFEIDLDGGTAFGAFVAAPDSESVERLANALADGFPGK